MTTSQFSVGDFIAVYEPLLADGREIVSVHLSAGISGTYESAVQARERLSAEGKGGERIHIVDSRTAAGGMSLVLVAAANAVKAGASAAEAAEAAEESRKTLKLCSRWTPWSTCGAAAASAPPGGRDHAEDQADPHLRGGGRVRRARPHPRPLDRAPDLLRGQRHDDGADGWVVQHIQDRESADRLIETCRDIFGCDPVFCSSSAWCSAPTPARG